MIGQLIPRGLSWSSCDVIQGGDVTIRKCCVKSQMGRASGQPTIAPGMAVCRLPTAADTAPMALACPKSASFAVRPSYRTFLEERSRCTMPGLVAGAVASVVQARQRWSRGGGGEARMPIIEQKILVYSMCCFRVEVASPAKWRR